MLGEAEKKEKEPQSAEDRPIATGSKSQLGHRMAFHNGQAVPAIRMTSLRPTQTASISRDLCYTFVIARLLGLPALRDLATARAPASRSVLCNKHFSQRLSAAV